MQPDSEEWINIPVAGLPDLTKGGENDNGFAFDIPPHGYVAIAMDRATYYRRMALVYLARERQELLEQQARVDAIRKGVIANVLKGVAGIPEYSDLDLLTKRLVDQLVEQHITENKGRLF